MAVITENGVYRADYLHELLELLIREDSPLHVDAVHSYNVDDAEQWPRRVLLLATPKTLNMINPRVWEIWEGPLHAYGPGISLSARFTDAELGEGEAGWMATEAFAARIAEIYSWTSETRSEYEAEQSNHRP